MLLTIARLRSSGGGVGSYPASGSGGVSALAGLNAKTTRSSGSFRSSSSSTTATTTTTTTLDTMMTATLPSSAALRFGSSSSTPAPTSSSSSVGSGRVLRDMKTAPVVGRRSSLFCSEENHTTVMGRRWSHIEAVVEPSAEILFAKEEIDPEDWKSSDGTPKASPLNCGDRVPFQVRPLVEFVSANRRRVSNEIDHALS